MYPLPGLALMVFTWVQSNDGHKNYIAFRNLRGE
jgi:hypothetical protein